MAEDPIDRHVARWRDHWIDVDFDDEVEGVTDADRHLARTSSAPRRQALADAGLQDFEYDTLHSLMIRDTPGTPAPPTWPTTSESPPPA